MLEFNIHTYVMHVPPAEQAEQLLWAAHVYIDINEQNNGAWEWRSFLHVCGSNSSEHRYVGQTVNVFGLYRVHYNVCLSFVCSTEKVSQGHVVPGWKMQPLLIEGLLFIIIINLLFITPTFYSTPVSLWLQSCSIQQGFIRQVDKEMDIKA